MLTNSNGSSVIIFLIQTSHTKSRKQFFSSKIEKLHCSRQVQKLRKFILKITAFYFLLIIKAVDHVTIANAHSYLPTHLPA